MDTSGPGSFTAVAAPSDTMVTVRRDGPAMSKSVSRNPAARTSNRMAAPVSPPTNPVTMVSWPSACSTRATLTPLPPARMSTAVGRCVAPRRSAGTWYVTSSAALSVTVRITAPPHPLRGDGTLRRLRSTVALRWRCGVVRVDGSLRKLRSRRRGPPSEDARADAAGVVAERGTHEPRLTLEGQPAHERLPQWRQQRVAGLRQPAADRDDFRRQQGDRRGQRARQTVDRPRPHRDRVGVTSVDRRRDLGRPGHRLAAAVGVMPRDERGRRDGLQAPPGPAAADVAVRVDDDVPDLAGVPVRVEPVPVDEERGRDPGADRHEH